MAVLDKPAGVVSEPGIGHKLDTLLNGLVARYGEAIDRLGPARDFGLVHRLDRDTSGLIVATRTAKARETLAAAFRKHKVEKAYVALLCGTPPESEGRVDIPLGRTRKRGRAVPVIGGAGTRPALTRYRIVERFGDYALVEARPETGRWHQVRLHFAAIGRPVAGDAEHGDVRANDRLAQQAALERLFLHSAVLGFDHPETGRRMTFRSHLPPPLGAVLDVLRGR